MEHIVIGTRGSALALWQAEWVAAALRRRHPGLEVRLELIVAPADAAPEAPIASLGTKGLFTKTLEDALSDGRIDLAVHSLKDLASAMPPGLALAAIPPREDPRDALILGTPLTPNPVGGVSPPSRREGGQDTAIVEFASRGEGEPRPLVPGAPLPRTPSRAGRGDGAQRAPHGVGDEGTLGEGLPLPPGARVGTSAPRRRAQLLHLRPDVQVLEVRGNVDTRLRKLQEGQYDALILAAAGLHRLGRREAISAYIDPGVLLPSGGQGALGLQARAGDARIHALVAPLADPATTLCCTAERRLQEVLEGGCRVPIGALARLDGATLTLEAVVASEDGALLMRAALSGPAGAPLELGERLAARLLDRGAGAILRAIPGGDR